MADRDITKRMGAIAKNGVKAASKPGMTSRKKPRSKGGRSATPTRFAGVSDNDRKAIEAWEAYTRASKALLDTTGSASLLAAENHVRSAQARADAVRKERQLRAPKNGPGRKRGSSADSRSIRTVSGGAPGLGKRR